MVSSSTVSSSVGATGVLFAVPEVSGAVVASRRGCDEERARRRDDGATVGIRRAVVEVARVLELRCSRFFAAVVLQGEIMSVVVRGV